MLCQAKTQCQREELHALGVLGLVIVDRSAQSTSSPLLQMPSDSRVPSPLALYLREPIKGIQPFDVTDALVRSAISSGATCIHIVIKEGVFQFAHDGNPVTLGEIQDSWHREATTGILDLEIPHSLALAQMLFFARSMLIGSCYRRTRLTLETVTADTAWEYEQAMTVTGTVISAIGVRDPWAFVLSGPGKYDAFYGCPIPLLINGAPVPRLPREDNPNLVEVEGTTVYVDLATAHKGFRSCIGGMSQTTDDRLSIVYMNPRHARFTTSMEMANLQDFTNMARRAMKKAVGHLLLRIEAESGSETLLRNHYKALLRYFPEMTLYSDSISSQAICFADRRKQPRNGDPVLYPQSMLTSSSNPVFCDMPQVPASLDAGNALAAYQIAHASDGMYVDPDCFLPVSHWLRKTAWSFSGASISVRATGNVLTPRELVYDRVKVRLANHISARVLTQDGRVFDQSIEDWILAEEEAQTQSDLELASAHGSSKLLVLYVNRNCTELRVPSIQCTKEFRMQIGSVLLEVRQFMKENSGPKLDLKYLLFGHKREAGGGC